MRKNQGVLIDLLVIASSLPWWIGVCVAMVSYLIFHEIATIHLSPSVDLKSLGSFAGKQLLITISFFAQYAVPGAILIGSLISIFRRKKSSSSAKSSKSIPTPSPNPVKYQSNADFESVNNEIACPVCGKQMVKRTTRKGPNSGKHFWGCSTFPMCKGIRPF